MTAEAEAVLDEFPGFAVFAQRANHARDIDPLGDREVTRPVAHRARALAPIIPSVARRRPLLPRAIASPRTFTRAQTKFAAKIKNSGRDQKALSKRRASCRRPRSGGTRLPIALTSDPPAPALRRPATAARARAPGDGRLTERKRMIKPLSRAPESRRMPRLSSHRQPIATGIATGMLRRSLIVRLGLRSVRR